MKKYSVLLVLLFVVLLSACGVDDTEAVIEDGFSDDYRQSCYDQGGLISKDGCVPVPEEPAPCPKCPETEVCPKEPEQETSVDSNKEAYVPGTNLGYNTGLLIGLGFPGSDWVIPDEVKNWACPQQIAEGDWTYGPYTETKDSETRVWIGYENKMANMPYTFSYAACVNPAEKISEQPFFTGVDKNPVDELIFNVIFNDQEVDRKVTFPD